MLATQLQIQLIWIAEPYSCNTNNINLGMFQILHFYLTFAIWAESVVPKKRASHAATFNFQRAEKLKHSIQRSIEIAVTILFAVKLRSTHFIYNIFHSISLPLKQALSLFSLFFRSVLRRGGP